MKSASGVSKSRERAHTTNGVNGASHARVLFGTDAFDGGKDQSWEAGALIATNSARRALGLALTGMMRDGVITRERAEQLARMVLRENAVALYGLGAPAARARSAP